MKENGKWVNVEKNEKKQKQKTDKKKVRDKTGKSPKKGADDENKQQ